MRVRHFPHRKALHVTGRHATSRPTPVAGNGQILTGRRIMKPDEFKIRFQEVAPIEIPETNTQLSPWFHAVRGKLCFDKRDIVLIGKERDPSTDSKLLTTTYGNVFLGLIYRILVPHTRKPSSDIGEASCSLDMAQAGDMVCASIRGQMAISVLNMVKSRCREADMGRCR
jgi:hypothetical protein